MGQGGEQEARSESRQAAARRQSERQRWRKHCAAHAHTHARARIRADDENAPQIALGDEFAADKIATAVVDSTDLRDVVLEFAAKNGCDTIVVGSRGNGVIKRALLGSLSTFLVHESPIPVVVVRSE